MSTELKAIETRYAGCRFRSRLEARWTVFFDALGIKWEYEKEGFHLGSRQYLPDFFLPEQRLWLEVKGERPTGAEIGLCFELAARLDEPMRVGIVWGGIPKIEVDDEIGRYACIEGGMTISPSWWIGSWASWRECGQCGSIDLVPINGGCPKHGGLGELVPMDSDDRIVEAFARAGSARFEYGEKG